MDGLPFPLAAELVCRGCEQTRWVMLGLVTALEVFFLVGLLYTEVHWLTAAPEHAVLFGLIAPTLAYLGMGFLPITFAIAILCYRLWDIDLILNRTLVYVGLTASVIGLYVLVVVGLGAVAIDGLHSPGSDLQER